MSHPNIVQFIGISTTLVVPVPGNTPPFCLISEWMPQGTLAEYLKARPETSRHELVRSLSSISQPFEFHLSS
ncbi:hypothetical protein JAAARDRAFT_430595 [Jaapia argillacea MUCL 33604]|uniref:Serine-threonine/tyrosine-protein kinase catalytic domain-containing protein n=1 Tax=Jaapia argillacea MUCL 33604 TaxID=933084 RepID=A0A067PFT3_9AGAM|nr:hypothetical protein JAAARDRAFT_430595 [Jaapia argillacea MUCL 33604]